MAETEVLCFDVYGSTHNQHSIVETLADVADVSLGVAEEMSELWVEHQIDYSMEVTSSPPYSLAFARSLRVGLPVSTTRFAGTERVPVGSAVSAGVDSGQPVPTCLSPRTRML
jgi:hypothetical protein